MSHFDAGKHNQLHLAGERMVVREWVSTLKFDRIKYWLSVGAQASDRVQRLLFRSGLLPPPPMVAMGHKGGERDTRVVHPMTGRYLDAEKKAAVMDKKPKEEDNAEDKSP